MKKLKFLIFSILFLISNFALSQTIEKFQLKNTTVQLQNSSKWYSVQGFFGSDLSLLGAEGKEGESRAALSIYDSEAGLSEFPVEPALKNKNEFFQGRKDWITSQGGQYLNEKSAREIKYSDKNNTGLELSFEYILEGKKFREYSYYMTCNGEFLFIKGLVPEKHINKSEENQLKSIAESLSCLKPGTGVRKSEISKAEMNDLLKKLKNKNSALLAIKHVREFMLNFEKENTDLDTYAYNDFKSEKSSNPNWLISKFFKYSILINEAVAQGVYKAGNSCVFAGWISTFKKKSDGKLTCQNPTVGATSYSSSCSGANSFQCNPILYGPGVCIGGSNRELLQSATFRCDSKKRSNEEIASYASQNPDQLNEMVQSTNQLCTDSNYLKNNPDLCGSLIHQLSQISGSEDGNENTVGEAEDAYNNFTKNKQIDDEDYEKAKDAIQEQAKNFEQFCMSSSNEFVSGIVDIDDGNGNTAQLNCDEEYKLLQNNLKKLKNAEDKDLGANSSKPVCENPNNDLGKQSGKINDALLNLNCAEKKEGNAFVNCAKDIQCAAIGSVQAMGSSLISLLEKTSGKKNVPAKNCSYKDNCLVNAASALANGFISTLKGLGTMAYEGARLAKDYTVNKATEVYNWATNSKVENDSSKRMHALSKTVNKTFDEFKKDPWGFIGNFVKSIINGVSQFMTDDVFCMKWSGKPRFSTCEKPLPSLGCMDCKTLINGSCAAIGYAVEKIGETLTGSWFAGLGVGMAKGVSLKIANILKASAKSGKLAKVEASILKNMPNLAKGAKIVGKGTMEVAKVGAKVGGVVAKQTFATASKGLKYLGGKTIQPLLSKLAGLKPVKFLGSAYTGSIAQKVVLKSGVFKNQLVDLHKKLYNNGLQTGLRFTSPKAAAGRQMASEALATMSKANETKVDYTPPKKTGEEKFNAYKQAREKDALDTPFEDVPNADPNQKKLSSSQQSSNANTNSQQSKQPDYTPEQAAQIKDVRKKMNEEQIKFDNANNTYEKLKDTPGKENAAKKAKKLADSYKIGLDKYKDELSGLRASGPLKESAVPGLKDTDTNFRTVAQDVKGVPQQKAYSGFKEDFGGTVPKNVEDLANQVHNTPTWLDTGKPNPAKADALSKLRNEMQTELQKSGKSAAEASKMTQERLKELKKTGVLGSDAKPSFENLSNNAEPDILFPRSDGTFSKGKVSNIDYETGKVRIIWNENGKEMFKNIDINKVKVHPDQVRKNNFINEKMAGNPDADVTFPRSDGTFSKGKVTGFNAETGRARLTWTENGEVLFKELDIDRIKSNPKGSVSSSASSSNFENAKPKEIKYSEQQAEQQELIRKAINEQKVQYDTNLTFYEKYKGKPGRENIAANAKDKADRAKVIIDEKKVELNNLREVGVKEKGLDGLDRTNSGYRTMEQDLGNGTVKPAAYNDFKKDFGGKLPDKVEKLANDVHNTPTYLSTGKLNPTKAEKISELRKQMINEYQSAGKSVKESTEMAKKRINNLTKEGVLGADVKPSFDEMYNNFKTSEGVAKRDAQLAIESTYGREFRDARAQVKAANEAKKAEEAFSQTTSANQNRPTFEQAMKEYKDPSKSPNEKLQIQKWLEKNHYEQFKNPRQTQNNRAINNFSSDDPLPQQKPDWNPLPGEKSIFNLPEKRIPNLEPKTRKKFDLNNTPDVKIVTGFIETPAKLLRAGNETTKVGRFADKVYEKMDIEFVSSPADNAKTGSLGSFSDDATLRNKYGQDKQTKLLVGTNNIAEGKITAVEIHEIGHGKTIQNISKNIEDPLAINFYPKNSTRPGFYESYAQADESRQMAHGFMNFVNQNANSDILSDFTKIEKISYQNIYGTTADNFKKAQQASEKIIDNIEYLNDRHLKILNAAEDKVKNNLNYFNSTQKKDLYLSNYSSEKPTIQMQTELGNLSIPLTPDYHTKIIAAEKISADKAHNLIQEYTKNYINKANNMLSDQTKAIQEAKKILNDISSNPDKKITKAEYLKQRDVITKVKTSVNIKNPDVKLNSVNRSTSSINSVKKNKYVPKYKLKKEEVKWNFDYEK